MEILSRFNCSVEIKGIKSTKNKNYFFFQLTKHQMLFILSPGKQRPVVWMSAAEKIIVWKLKCSLEKHSSIKHSLHRSVREGHALLTHRSTVKTLLPWLMKGIQ